MTTYVEDGKIFECNGHTFEGVNDTDGQGRRYLGFTCLDCDEGFSTDPADHECQREQDICGLCGVREPAPGATACRSCA